MKHFYRFLVLTIFAAIQATSYGADIPGSGKGWSCSSDGTLEISSDEVWELGGTGFPPTFPWLKSELVKKVIIANGVDSIAYSAFMMLENLESASLPNGLRKILTQAFQGCDKLASVTIPASVKLIGDQAFTYCTNLKSIAFLAETPMDMELEIYIPGINFTATVTPFDSKVATAYVPAGSVAAYKAKDWVQKFFADVRPLSEMTALKDVNGNTLSVCVENGFVKVAGTTDFNVYDVLGHVIPHDRPLPTGVYVVMTGGGSSTKVVVR